MSLRKKAFTPRLILAPSALGCRVPAVAHEIDIDRRRVGNAGQQAGLGIGGRGLGAPCRIKGRNAMLRQVMGMCSGMIIRGSKRDATVRI